MYVIEPMVESDIAAVSRLEKRCFSNPWPQSAYRRELRNAAQNFYIVLRDRPDDAPVRGNGATEAGWSEVGVGPRISRLALLSRVRKGIVDAPASRLAPIVGFAGFWQMFDEAHITTIGVDPDLRGRSLGELLLVALIEESIRRGAGYLSLEVRVSNTVAIRLYEKYGFSIKGVRPRYYVDDGEDAYVMWSDSVRAESFRTMLDDRRERLFLSLDGSADLPVRTLLDARAHAVVDGGE